MYESGKYENVEKALEFYKRSMALGNFYAQYNYENLIKKQKK
jgi:TPR repeat protein